MEYNQYSSSLSFLYRIYPKNLPHVDYDYLNNLIDHYSKKGELTTEEAKKAEDRCREEWRKFILFFFDKIEKQTKRYRDLLAEEDKDFKKIKTRIEENNLPLGEYEDEWDKLDNVYRKALSKVNSERRNFRRNWIGHLISFILGIAGTIVTGWIIKIIWQ